MQSIEKALKYYVISANDDKKTHKCTFQNIVFDLRGAPDYAFNLRANTEFYADNCKFILGRGMNRIGINAVIYL